MVKFGERLKAARAAKHMSQQMLADVIGKSLNTVGLYERGLCRRGYVPDAVEV